MNKMSVLIAENLYFDVMRFCKIFFEEQTLVTESVQGFTPRQFDGIFQFTFGVDDAHPFAAAACRRFDENGITDLVRGFLEVFVAFQAFEAGDGGNARFLHQYL